MHNSRCTTYTGCIYLQHIAITLCSLPTPVYSLFNIVIYIYTYSYS